MRRGEVWWAEHPAGQRHPVLLLSWDAHGDWRDRVTVALITSTVRGHDAEVVLTRDDGMPRPSAANLDDLVTIKRDRLGRRICELPADRMAQVELAIHHALGVVVPCLVGT
ncbi:MAG: type II toxin-antitoxin system PemK/MazF family toxin [Acidimicrobiales bacterium]